MQIPESFANWICIDRSYLQIITIRNFLSNVILIYRNINQWNTHRSESFLGEQITWTFLGIWDWYVKRNPGQKTGAGSRKQNLENMPDNEVCFSGGSERNAKKVNSDTSRYRNIKNIVEKISNKEFEEFEIKRRVGIVRTRVMLKKSWVTTKSIKETYSPLILSLHRRFITSL